MKKNVIIVSALLSYIMTSRIAYGADNVIPTELMGITVENSNIDNDIVGKIIVEDSMANNNFSEEIIVEDSATDNNISEETAIEDEIIKDTEVENGISEENLVKDNIMENNNDVINDFRSNDSVLEP